ncbi:MAG: hypothetical protein P4M15_13910 [Alphaproteobacteria bacterium]|nr:hypothetical protein [Alphaproteobacteria bacterium]
MEKITDDELIAGDFPGASKMGLPFREAVEKFFDLKFLPRVKHGLTKTDIYREDIKFYSAMFAYERRFGVAVCDIPSERDILQNALETFFREGVAVLEPKQRIAIGRKYKRTHNPARSSLDKSTPTG